MEPTIAAAVLIVFVVACAWYRFKPNFNLHPVPLLALSVVLTGSVLGSEFFSLPSGPIPITLDRILIGATVALFAWYYLRGKEDLRRLNTADITILLLMAVIFTSTITHDWTFLEKMPASRLLFFNLLPLAVYWVVRSCKLGPAELKFIATSMGVFGVYLALTAIAEVKDVTALIYPKYILTSEIKEFLGRGRGPFLNPVSNGICMTTCFCCLLMWWPRVGRRGKFIALGLGLVLAVGVYATLTRSVWLGFVAACGIFIWIPASRPAKGGMIIVATLVAVVSFPVLSENIFSFKRDKEVSQSAMEQSAQMRPMFALIAWNMFQDRPIVGCGFGQYAREKYPYLQDPHSGKPLSVTKSLMQHNVFLAYVTETGIIGLSCLILMLMQMTRVSWKVFCNRSADLWARQFGLVSLVILACYCLNGMFHDVSIIPMQHMLMFFIFGIVNNIDSKPRAFRLVWTTSPSRSNARRTRVRANQPNQLEQKSA
ncbi:MAG: O-antigen ligase [Mariniblastus sp.]|jgi:O-antigen ligase